MKYRIYVNEDQLEKIKRYIPNIRYQILNNIQPRSARSIEWREINEKRYKEYQKKYQRKYRLKKKKEKKKSEQQSTKTKSKTRRMGIR